MYLKKLWIENIWDNKSYCWDFLNQDSFIRRWSIIECPDHDQEKNTLIFKILGICLGAEKYIPQLKEEILTFQQGREKTGYFGVLLRPDPHKEKDGKDNKRDIIIQYEILPGGEIRFSRKWNLNYKDGRRLTKGFNDLTKAFGWFAYGYNSRREHVIHEDLDPAMVPRLRSARFGTLFNQNFPLTCAEKWLNRQYRNAARYNSKRAEYLYNVSMSLILGIFKEIAPFPWEENSDHPFSEDSESFLFPNKPDAHILLMDFLIDLVRNMGDSQERAKDFNLSEGILFIDSFENLFGEKAYLNGIKTLSSIFPHLQFIVSCSAQGLRDYLNSLFRESIPCRGAANDIKQWILTRPSRARLIRQERNNFLKSRFKSNHPVSADPVVLIDVDSAIPNLALMKISRYYKNEGRKVILTRDSSAYSKARSVFASCIFRRSTTEGKINRLKYFHGDNLRIGGSGFDLSLRLPEEIESLRPDYTLYPGMNYALGFLTRGCPNSCNYCVVPIKDGKLKQVADIEDLVPAGQQRLILLDDNLLAFPEVNQILREIIQRNLQINFNQTLDLRYLTPEKADLLQMIDSRNYTFTKRMFYFSLNSAQDIPPVAEKLKLLDKLKMSEIMFICMYGYHTTLSEDIKRFSFIQRLGVLPFVQKFEPINDLPVPMVDNYFDSEIEPLTGIYFRQNGRNFEKFLKWVSKKYVEKFGELYMPLVDLIFKFNHKQLKYKYIETLAGTRKIFNI